jgi:hypothetical protein
LVKFGSCFLRFFGSLLHFIPGRADLRASIRRSNDDVIFSPIVPISKERHPFFMPSSTTTNSKTAITVQRHFHSQLLIPQYYNRQAFNLRQASNNKINNSLCGSTRIERTIKLSEKEPKFEHDC